MGPMSTQQTTEYVDPADLICPGCTEQVRCEPPGYWRVAWGLPAPGFSHEDGSALCLAHATGRPPGRAGRDRQAVSGDGREEAARGGAVGLPCAPDTARHPV